MIANYNYPEAQAIIIMDIDKLIILSSNLKNNNEFPNVLTFHVIQESPKKSPNGYHRLGKMLKFIGQCY